MMRIPKVIYQTFKTSKVPLVTKWHIWRMKKRNPEYAYQFYDDAMIEDFIQNSFEKDVFELYKKINLGAAKADFFRYAILYKKGGVYLDIDSMFLTKIDEIITPEDSAVISLETHGVNYVQWALFFEAGHPFLKETLTQIIENIKTNKYPKDVYRMTGPEVFTKAIKKCKEAAAVHYREIGADYDKKAKFSYPMSKFFLYGFSRKTHWRNQSKTKNVLK